MRLRSYTGWEGTSVDVPGRVGVRRCGPGRVKLGAMPPLPRASNGLVFEGVTGETRGRGALNATLPEPGISVFAGPVPRCMLPRLTAPRRTLLAGVPSRRLRVTPEPAGAATGAAGESAGRREGPAGRRGSRALRTSRRGGSPDRTRCSARAAVLVMDGSRAAAKEPAACLSPLPDSCPKPRAALTNPSVGGG